jgi:hypothetical protein
MKKCPIEIEQVKKELGGTMWKINLKYSKKQILNFLSNGVCLNK